MNNYETEQLETYRELVQRLNDDNFDRMTFTHAPSDYITLEYGQKYVRVVKNDRAYDSDGKEFLTGSKSVHSFVDLSNGNILKGSWKAPIRTKKGLAIRGNIFEEDCGASSITEFGPKYLR